MRLFLASEDLGDFPEELLRLAGDGRKLLLISNARDYYPLEKRVAKIGEKLAYFKSVGFDASELDLRNYFGKPEELKAFIDEQKPDVIYSIGGNVFLLRTAMKLSGMDKIIIDGVKNDRFVYGGYSAGIMVTCQTLRLYGHDHLVPEKVPEIYGVEAELDGLGLIDIQLVPHADLPVHLETTKMYMDHFKQAGKKALALNQNAVLIINGDERRVLGQ